MRTLEILQIGRSYGYYIGEALIGVDIDWNDIVNHLSGRPVTLRAVQDWTGKLAEFPADKRRLGPVDEAPDLPDLGGGAEFTDEALAARDIAPTAETTEPVVETFQGIGAQSDGMEGYGQAAGSGPDDDNTDAPETGHGEGSPADVDAFGGSDDGGRARGPLTATEVNESTRPLDRDALSGDGEEPLLDGGGN